MSIPDPQPVTTDPYAWLEEVEGDRALAWVAARNDATAAGLGADPGLAETEAEILAVLDSQDKIPYVSLVGDRLYNFWRDAEHPRGLWRRTTPDSYRSGAPEWETVLDVDALAAAEGRSWVWHGASIRRPDRTRAIVDLSDGGSDADTSRELDLETLTWVDPAAGGFARPESKGGLTWIDADTVFGFAALDEDTSTSSGYPRRVVRLRRGQAWDDAQVVYEGQADDLYISAFRTHQPGYERSFVSRGIAFYSSELYLLTDDDELRLVDVPRSAEASVRGEWLLVELRDPWETTDARGTVRTFAAGSLLAAPFDAYLDGDHRLTALFEPTPTTSLAGAVWTRHHLVLTVLDDVKNALHALTPPDVAGGDDPYGPWARSEVPGAPALGTTSVTPVDADDSDDLWMVSTDYLTPTTLSVVHVAGPGEEPVPPEPLRSEPTFFDASGLEVTQHFAVSDDGTRVPYFQVRRADAPLDGTAPTLLYGYGGFEISLTPSYSGALGRAWLARGGTYVVANIRGGGEYGPRWHQAALRENRHRAYEDFAAVARDLVARGVTSPEHLGVQGGSNGGLLTGNMLTQFPELFGAVVVQVPLLDMRRYTHLLAGASWAAEYGDPDDPEQWEFVRTFSPYHLFDAGKDYPPVLFTTSTRDDRVHPGHARKMAAQMLDAGKDVTYYENVEGGHGGAATNAQAAHMAALAYRFLAQRLA